MGCGGRAAKPLRVCKGTETAIKAIKWFGPGQLVQQEDTRTGPSGLSELLTPDRQNVGNVTHRDQSNPKVPGIIPPAVTNQIVLWSTSR